MRRTRMMVAALGVALAACTEGTPDQIATVPIATVSIAATPCDRPTARLGVGTVVAEGLVLTAAHVVEDDLRDLEVDEKPARVVALDVRLDAAVVALDRPTDSADRGNSAAATSSDVEIADAVRIVTPTDVIETAVLRIVTLSVDDATDEVVHRRQALVLAGTVPGGTSGAPVVDGDGRIVGMVTISHTARDVTYATRTGDLQPLIDAASASGNDSVTRSSLAAQSPCA